MDSVLRQPAAMVNLKGRIALMLPRDSTAYPAIDHRAVFFTYGLISGKILGVQEVKRITITSGSALASVKAQLIKTDSALVDSTIVAGARDADAVVLVRVDSVVPPNVPDSIAALGSEHTPDWAIATAHVLKLYRSQTGTISPDVVALFPKGGTSLTENAPELQVGQRRILWLHQLSRLPAALRAGIPTAGRYFILEARDARAASDSGRVGLLLPP